MLRFRPTCCYERVQEEHEVIERLTLAKDLAVIGEQFFDELGYFSRGERVKRVAGTQLHA